MATYTITAKITVSGNHIKTKNDAIVEVAVMKNAYEEMNDKDSSITIRIDEVERKKVKK